MQAPAAERSAAGQKPQTLPVHPWSRSQPSIRQPYRSLSAEIVSRRFAGSPIRNDFEFDLLALVEAMQASAFHRADMHEDILAAIVRLNETETFLTIEPLHGSL
jgi:hypothetical protein